MFAALILINACSNLRAIHNLHFIKKGHMSSPTPLVVSFHIETVSMRLEPHSSTEGLLSVRYAPVSEGTKACKEAKT